MEHKNNRLARLVRSYEEKLEQGVPFYMEAADMADIVEYYTGQGRDYDAETCLRIAQNLHPDDVDLSLQRAYILKNAGKWEEALEIVVNVNDPSRRSYGMFMAEYNLASLNFKNAVKCIEELLQQTQEGFDLYDTMEEAAEIFFDYGFFDQSLFYLNKIPAHYEQYLRCQSLKADCLFHKRQPQEAAAILNETIDASPYDDQLWTIMADGQMKNKLFDAAIESCEYALAINPENVQAERIRMLSMFQVRPITDWFTFYREYITKYSNDYSVAMLAAESAYNEGQYALSLEEAQRAYASVPLDSSERARILRVVLLSLIRNSRVSEAAALMQGASTMGVQFNDTLCEVSEYLVSVGETASAVQMLQQLSSFDELTEMQLCRVVNLSLVLTKDSQARKLWEEIYEKHAQPFVIAQTALAFRKLRHPLYAQVLLDALHMAPLYVEAYFEDIYPETDLFQMYLAAQAESAQWE